MVIVLTSPLVKAETTPGGRRGRRRGSGLGLEIALATAAAGGRVEIVGKVGDDEAGNAIAVELERAGVGHAALLRDPSTGTPVDGRDAPLALGRADVELALRYLVDFRVVISADRLSAEASEVVAEAARYAGAHRVIVAEADARAANVPGVDATGADPTEDDVTVLAAPGAQAGADRGFATLAAFAAFVGRYAGLLDTGRAPRDAFETAAAETGREPARHA
jgi:hypothetical protein